MPFGGLVHTSRTANFHGRGTELKATCNNRQRNPSPAVLCKRVWIGIDSHHRDPNRGILADQVRDGRNCNSRRVQRSRCTDGREIQSTEVSPPPPPSFLSPFLPIPPSSSIPPLEFVPLSMPPLQFSSPMHACPLACIMDRACSVAAILCISRLISRTCNFVGTCKY